MYELLTKREVKITRLILVKFFLPVCHLNLSSKSHLISPTQRIYSCFEKVVLQTGKTLRDNCSVVSYMGNGCFTVA